MLRPVLVFTLLLAFFVCDSLQDPNLICGADSSSFPSNLVSVGLVGHNLLFTFADSDGLYLNALDVNDLNEDQPDADAKLTAKSLFATYLTHDWPPAFEKDSKFEQDCSALNPAGPPFYAIFTTEDADDSLVGYLTYNRACAIQSYQYHQSIQLKVPRFKPENWYQVALKTQTTGLVKYPGIYSYTKDGQQLIWAKNVSFLASSEDNLIYRQSLNARNLLTVVRAKLERQGGPPADIFADESGEIQRYLCLDFERKKMRFGVAPCQCGAVKPFNQVLPGFASTNNFYLFGKHQVIIFPTESFAAMESQNDFAQQEDNSRRWFDLNVLDYTDWIKCDQAGSVDRAANVTITN